MAIVHNRNEREFYERSDGRRFANPQMSKGDLVDWDDDHVVTLTTAGLTRWNNGRYVDDRHVDLWIRKDIEGTQSPFGLGDECG